MPVVIFDPGNFTPYYVDGLCRGLAALGVRAQVITSPPLFEPVDTNGLYDVAAVFSPWLRGAAAGRVRHHRRVRRAVRAAGYPAGLLRTWRFLRSLPPGLLHIQWALAPGMDVRLVRALKRRGWRLVCTAHDRPPGVEHGQVKAGYRALLGACDAVVVHTPALGAELRAACPELAERTHVIAHGGDVPEPPDAAERGRARRRIGLDPDDGPVLLCFGMMKPYKGIPYLIDAMPRIVSALPRTRLVIAGEPLMPIGPLVDRARQLHLERAVVWHPSFVPTGDVRQYFAAADLVVAPHVDCAASGVIVTAQGFGTAVVATRVGGFADLIEADGCGVVVPPRSAEALADAICRTAADPGRLAEMGRRGRQRLQRDGSWTAVARRTLALYEARA